MSIILNTPQFLRKYLPKTVYLVKGGDNGRVLAEYKRLHKAIVLYREFFLLAKEQQKYVLYHECGHAIGLKHDEQCPLMCTYLPDTIASDSVYEQILRKVKNEQIIGV